MPRGQYTRTKKRTFTWGGITALERFMKFVNILPNGCWEWTGSLNVGYGGFTLILNGKRTRISAHLASLHLHGRGLPGKGMECDHACHKIAECSGGAKCPHRRCVNPDHLEVVTEAENRRRSHGTKPANDALRNRTHCAKGHLLDESNIYWHRGVKICRMCRLICEQKRPKRAKPCPTPI